MTKREILFVTGNLGKVASLRGHLKLYDVDVTVVQKQLNLIEPQAATAAEVARAKARQAHALLKKPLLVDDSSFHIDALNGFPGPYIKYMLETLCPEGIVKLMEGTDNRRAYFKSALVFADKTGKLHTFEGEDGGGTIATYVSTASNPQAWSDLWKILIPTDADKPFSELTEDEMQERRNNRGDNSTYHSFAKWVAKEWK